MINDTKIKCFLTLAETLNFSSTANALFMTQQAVSKSIAALEKELGFPLFVRTTRSVILTKAGAKCYDFFSRFYKEYYEFIAEVQHEHSIRTSYINVGFQNYLDFGSAPKEALVALKKKNCALQLNGFRYCPNILVERLCNQNLDLILINGRFAPNHNDFKYLELTKMRLMLMVSADHPLATENATYKDFAEEPLITEAFVNESPVEFNNRVKREVGLWGLKPSKVICAPDRDSAYTSAELGIGIVVGIENSRMAINRNLKCYYMGMDDNLLAMWRPSDKMEVVEKYAYELQQVYKNKSQ
ncbi:MAG: LysR family transcriptional regulator [Peptococcaceae bacterium]|nr:LysR family transcriptional regulator [Peptococcaceae bacterium]